MSLWISSIKQLEPVRHLLSPLLLDFMEAAWPSSISMVILRGKCAFMYVYYCVCLCWCLMTGVYVGFSAHTGPWMDTFGLGDAAKHIGTPQSIAIRNPDCSVATHLINMVRECIIQNVCQTSQQAFCLKQQLFFLQVGPIAVTSANPTGEADTTHHNQVYAKLGKKVKTILY